ncbi:MAG: S41 family peptidase [Bacteroidetes bacterium]|nr:S41 family peptidase [Bacteroidota bacterium]
MKRFFASSSRFIVGTVLVSILVAATVLRDDLFELRKNFEIFGALYEEIAINYVDDVRPQPFMRAGIDAMLSQLDPYTHYFDEADMVDMQLMQRRKIGTVGLNVGLRGGRLTVLAPENNAAAYRQGIRTGDIILQIGETPTDNVTVEEAYELLMGQPRTTVEVLVQRGAELSPRVFVLPRALPRSQNVSYSGYLGPDSTAGLAYLKLDIFGDRSAREVKRALRNMDRVNPLKGIVLDLRGNPGGILGEAVDIVELFVPKGSLVVSTRTRVDNAVQEFKTDADPLFPEVPMVVLIDRYSASASEIVAGALQDYDRAVIMGETSFGKGLVQITRPLPHNTLLKLTVSHYYLPTGRTIQSFELNSASARVAVPTLTSFVTAGKRPVRGGAGVEPDRRIVVEPSSELESVLLQESAYFLFADLWVDRHCAAAANAGAPGTVANTPVSGANTPGVGATISKPLDQNCLAQSGATFDEFREWLPQSGIQLVTDSELMLTRLESEFALSNYHVQSEMNSLKSALLAQKTARLGTLRPNIDRRIEEEIRSRLLSEKDQNTQLVASDTWIAEALQLVRDSGAVGRILN